MDAQARCLRFYSPSLMRPLMGSRALLPTSLDTAPRADERPKAETRHKGRPWAERAPRTLSHNLRRRQLRRLRNNEQQQG